MRGRRGGFTIEYAMLTVIVTAALLGMAFYLQRGLAGRWRESADTFGFGRQYEPGKTVISESTTTPPPTCQACSDSDCDVDPADCLCGIEASGRICNDGRGCVDRCKVCAPCA